MSEAAVRLNELYLREMTDARNETGLGRIRDLWWDTFLERIENEGIEDTLDSLNECMSRNRDRLGQLAQEYASGKGFAPGSPKHQQLAVQFLKSNTGKMFERFVGLSLAHALRVSDACYCVQPFRTDTIPLCHGLSRQDFSVNVALGTLSYSTEIDADIFIFDPDDSGHDIYAVSVKSTLKDRFHNVPFWNLLRRAALSPAFQELRPANPGLLAKLKYIAVCTDLAEEQPDFANVNGPRNLLCIDAALLDGAYVSASNAHGLGDGEPHLGPARVAPFHPLSQLFASLTAE
jgi:hypothetical protein